MVKTPDTIQEEKDEAQAFSKKFANAKTKRYKVNDKIQSATWNAQGTHVAAAPLDKIRIWDFAGVSVYTYYIL